jgi:hypothetical protein
MPCIPAVGEAAMRAGGCGGVHRLLGHTTQLRHRLGHVVVVALTWMSVTRPNFSSTFIASHWQSTWYHSTHVVAEFGAPALHQGGRMQA